jgi:homoserine O-acetyltransferase
MLDTRPRQQRYLTRNFRLADGTVLEEVTTAYCTLGTLNATGTNAVLVLHGYTTGPAMLEAGANVAEGSWSELVGTGKAIDTNQYFVICPNMLGSCYGSTGPASPNAATGKSFGADFPRITLADIVEVQRLLLEDIGVHEIAAVAGPSYGGYQAFQWAVSYPDRVKRVIAAVSAPFHPPAAAQSAPLLARLSAEPTWCNGHPAPGAMVDWLTDMRVATLTHYGVDTELAARIPDAPARAAEIRRLARVWAEGFDAGSLVTLAHAAETFDLRQDLGRIRAPLLLVLSRSDPVFSPQLFRDLAPQLNSAKLRWSYVELDSDKGHFASGADAQLWSAVLRNFMSADPDAWTSSGVES